MENNAGKKETNDSSDMGSEMFGEWMKASYDFFGKMAEIQTQALFSGALGKGASGNPFENFGKTQASKTEKMWKINAKIFQNMFEQSAGADSHEMFRPLFDIIPNLLLKTSSEMMEGFMKLQEKTLEHASGFNEKTGPYDFSDLNRNIYNSFREIYESEFQKLFTVPKLGLLRFYQERFDQYLDKATLFNTALSEFIHTFYAPMEKTSVAMQEKIDRMLDEGALPENYKEIYILWIKTLEGHYMTLLKSDEYTRILHKTLDALVLFRKAKSAIIEDFLKDFPIPTQSEMDELYKDLYLLKKRVTALEKDKEQAP